MELYSSAVFSREHPQNFLGASGCVNKGDVRLVRSVSFSWSQRSKKQDCRGSESSRRGDESSLQMRRFTTGWFRRGLCRPIAYGILLRDLPYDHRERLVALGSWLPSRVPAGVCRRGGLFRLAERAAGFEDMALTRPAANDNLTGAGDPERLLGRGRPRGLFSTLRAEPLLASMGSRHRADARGRAESCCRRHAQSVGCGDLLVLYGSTGRGGAGGVSLTERSGSYAAGGI